MMSPMMMPTPGMMIPVIMPMAQQQGQRGALTANNQQMPQANNQQMPQMQQMRQEPVYIAGSPNS